MKVVCNAERNFAAHGVSLLLTGTDAEGNVYIAIPPALRRIDDVQFAERFMPTATISMDAAQELMDDLYVMGFRPSLASDSVTAMTAQKAHIEDLRKILFAFLDSEQEA